MGHSHLLPFQCLACDLTEAGEYAFLAHAAHFRHAAGVPLVSQRPPGSNVNLGARCIHQLLGGRWLPEPKLHPAALQSLHRPPKGACQDCSGVHRCSADVQQRLPSHLSTPAQATMTPLSVHRRGGGQTSCSPRGAASLCSTCLTVSLAATPPATTKVFTSGCDSSAHLQCHQSIKGEPGPYHKSRPCGSVLPGA